MIDFLISSGAIAWAFLSPAGLRRKRNEVRRFSQCRRCCAQHRARVRRVATRGLRIRWAALRETGRPSATACLAREPSLSDKHADHRNAERDVVETVRENVHGVAPAIRKLARL